MSVRSHTISAVLAGAMTLGACSAEAQNSGPTNDDFARAFTDIARGHPFLGGSLSNCRAGEVNGTRVQVCRFCVATVGIRFGEEAFERGGSLEVKRRRGSLAFRRAFSVEQPNIAPGPGERGVWVALGSTLQVEEVIYEVGHPTTSQVRRTGYVQRRGLGAWNSHWGNDMEAMRYWGGQLLPNVVENIEQDAELKQELRDLVSSCP